MGIIVTTFFAVFTNIQSHMLELSVNGTISAIRLELYRYTNKPVDFLDLFRADTAENALALENLIQHYHQITQLIKDSNHLNRV